MKVFENICLGTVTTAAAVLLLEGALFVREARISVDRIAGAFVELQEPTQKAIAQVAAAGKTFAQVGAHERDAFQQQQDYFAGLSRRTNTLLDSANVTLTDFNKNVLPNVTDSLKAATKLETDAGAGITATTAKVDVTLDALRPAIDNAIRASAAAASAMSDPAIHDSLDHFSAASGNLEGMSQDGRRMTADSAAYVHRMTAPARGTWNALEWLLGIAAKSRQASGF